jgi:hypothetical protein
LAVGQCGGHGQDSENENAFHAIRPPWTKKRKASERAIEFINFTLQTTGGALVQLPESNEYRGLIMSSTASRFPGAAEARISGGSEQLGLKPSPFKTTIPAVWGGIK